MQLSLYGTTHGNINKLQLVQNSLARIVTGTRKFDYISPVLTKLHWLPVSYRITYKITILTHKTLSTSQPGYLSSSIHYHHLPDTVITTRSVTLNCLTLPNIRNFRSDFSCRGFANCASTIWNNLPKDITDNTIMSDVFVKRLKTHLDTDLPKVISHLAAPHPRFLNPSMDIWRITSSLLIHSLTFFFVSLARRSVCQTVSYAAVRSRKTAPVFRFC